MEITEDFFDRHARGFLAFRKRIIFKNAIYHIVQRAPGREQLFLEEADDLYFLKLLKTSSTKFGLKIFAFALMPNHVHLLLQITEENLSKAMKHIFERYAAYYNKKYQRKGHVFYGRFWSSLCSDDEYFLSASVYIHLNPLKAGLCQQFCDYRWTSVHLYLNSPKESFVTCDPLLSLLDSDVAQARRLYVELLTNVSEQKIIPLIDRKSIRRAILSTISHIKMMHNRQTCEAGSRVIGEMEGLRCKRDVKSRQAKRYIIEQLRANGHTFKQIGEMFHIDRTTIYRLLKNATNAT